MRTTSTALASPETAVSPDSPQPAVATPPDASADVAELIETLLRTRRALSIAIVLRKFRFPKDSAFIDIFYIGISIDDDLAEMAQDLCRSISTRTKL